MAARDKSQRRAKGATLVEGEALLVVASYDFIELGAGERKAMPGTCLEQIANFHPAAGLELKSQPLRLVA